MRIGVIGAGQLGRMLALSGIPLGIEFLMYDRSADTPGAQVAPIVTGEFGDLARLRRFARQVDVVTFDWENIPVASLGALAGLAVIAPPARALEVAQDRLSEKRLFRRLGVPTAPFAAVDSAAALGRAVARIGLPGVLKTRRLGYDGKGQAWLHHGADVAPAVAALAGQALIYEGRVSFSREVSIVAVRGRDGEFACYPLADNVHVGGVLAVTRAPYVNARLQSQAEAHVRAVMERFRYVGVLCIEFFVERGRLVANEIAPRVHNSGHWTIEGAATSQFENHVRALAGLPLGSTRPRGHAVMVNLLGRVPDPATLLGVPGAHLHDYGKAPRPGRKVGHVTVVAESRPARERAATALLALAGHPPARGAR